MCVICVSFCVGLSVFVYLCVCMHSSFCLCSIFQIYISIPQFFKKIFWPCHEDMWNLSFPNQRLNLCPLQRKYRVLTSELPAKSSFLTYCSAFCTFTFHFMA